ncbi:MAG TPA: hypothetical protein PLK94_06725 [Alphaproteobacteria bacterium]|nr:hypothetical protein [Alphaproteobacteria bacterium]HOO50964.1 hypothetical protein [Alphaproteobacteria bacterium]
MSETILQTLGWWIAVIELPVLSALFWMIWNSRRDFESALQLLREDLSDHKVDVARTYAQTKDLRLLENRLTAHLLRIEAKLDATALKAEKNLNSSS